MQCGTVPCDVKSRTGNNFFLCTLRFPFDAHALNETDDNDQGKGDGNDDGEGGGKKSQERRRPKDPIAGALFDFTAQVAAVQKEVGDRGGSRSARAG